MVAPCQPREGLAWSSHVDGLRDEHLNRRAVPLHRWTSKGGMGKMMINLLCSPTTSKLGANHPEIGIRGDAKPGIHKNLRARPAGNFLYLEQGPPVGGGCLFVGRATWNARFLTEMKRNFVRPDPGCAKGWVEDPARIAELRAAGAEETESTANGSRVRFREPGGPIQLPGAIASPAWSASDSAGTKEVFYYAVRVKVGHTAYLQSSGYKGRRDWTITVLHSDGVVEKLALDEMRAVLASPEYL